jgi:hypothetical protein
MRFSHTNKISSLTVRGTVTEQTRVIITKAAERQKLQSQIPRPVCIIYAFQTIACNFENMSEGAWLLLPQNKRYNLLFTVAG